MVAVPSEVQSLKNGWVAEPLHGADRGRFLERVAELLAGVEIGDGSVARAARLAQSELWRVPDLARREVSLRATPRTVATTSRCGARDRASAIAQLADLFLDDVRQPLGRFVGARH